MTAFNEFLHWRSDGQTLFVQVAGSWTLEHYGTLAKIRNLQQEDTGGSLVPVFAGPIEIDLSDLKALDTAGAQRLYELLGPALETSLESHTTLPSERIALIRTVINAIKQAPASERAMKPPSPLLEILGRMGQAVAEAGKQAWLLLGFIGLTLQALSYNAFRPRRWRLTSVIWHIEHTGFNAVPIIALLTFMVGAVVAFLGATILKGFGASIYTINLVAFSFLREFAVLLTAILMAGRTASAFTAQIGSMKSNEELDALRMTGLNPIELLVLPRILALLVALPLLTFVGMVSGIAGGMMVCALSMDISPSMFLTIMSRDIDLRHFLLGMAKAPFFAYLIAIIGCLEGLKVKGSAQSIGQHTTSAVVQSIFVVILVDALAAIFFMEMGW
ncbi:ABC transporter permease [Neopusillimonas maritima]|uniref:MlaE family ABC transporter permease n=1 Tax=Neopusillimonas maritima TaxID=2026239 RepID=UPI001FEC8D80|nr:ABC transporter permease [Neopusillimonas maritima]